jgi:hypothetical protein
MLRGSTPTTQQEQTAMPVVSYTETEAKTAKHDSLTSFDTHIAVCILNVSAAEDYRYLGRDAV